MPVDHGNFAIELVGAELPVYVPKISEQPLENHLRSPGINHFNDDGHAHENPSLFHGQFLAD